MQMGIGVHHAGMIAVWKALVEDLFNANRIKVLFATETLAAGKPPLMRPVCFIIYALQV